MGLPILSRIPSSFKTVNSMIIKILNYTISMSTLFGWTIALLLFDHLRIVIGQLNEATSSNIPAQN